VLRYHDVDFLYEPYPIALSRNALSPEDYGEMVATFPDVRNFLFKEGHGVKYSLSRHNHRRGYFAHLDRHPVWRRFYDYVKSDAFIEGALAMLKQRHVDLGLGRQSFAQRSVKRFKAIKKGSPLPHFSKLSARFEFSAMPVTGGSIRPHTDDPSKVVTMVIPILAEGEWDPAYGGGTSVIRPKDGTLVFNRVNHYLDFDAVEEVQTFPFQPNQCLIFVKTYNSWHAVWPMTGNDERVLRKTLTINIEAS
jgi:hypothetical protein